MPSFGYSMELSKLNQERIALASGRDLNVSFKKMVELCTAIRGLKLKDAKKLLEDVIAKRKKVPYTRFIRKKAHHSDVEGYATGGYPVKAAKTLLKVLDNAENNAENKGLDTSRTYIRYAVAQKGYKIRKYIPRAFGRSTPYFRQLTHVEIVVEER